MTRAERQELVQRLRKAVQNSQLQNDLLDDVVAQKFGINRTDARCLDVLSNGPRSTSELARAAGLTASAMTAAVDRLEDLGLLERTSDPNDRRKIVVSNSALTDQLAQQIFGELMKRSMPVLRKYSDKELEVITNFLNEGSALQADFVEYLKDAELDWNA
jgi:DNA-binding MarR family transcriptional regulator